MGRKSATTSGRKFEELVALLRQLRGDRGCPWDKEQSPESIRDYFLEEVFEAVDAIEANDADSLREELGDVMMEVVFLARLYEERGAFDIREVLEGIVAKMIRRHPHVFGPRRIRSSRRVAAAWQRHKKAERERSSVLDGVPASAPALLRSFELGRRAGSIGFDWRRTSGTLNKAKEEWGELERALTKRRKKKVREELGDVLFTMASLARKLGYNPELVLREANSKFERRFRNLEDRLRRRGKGTPGATPAEMDEIWEELKKSGL